ncbi:GGDEF domain-containing protein [Shewanella indica]|uniref:GGDEF domain-containing protein n=1 Tax=Shewanella indica TaxID=768528 RepID=UPI0012FEA1C4|nr:GGDEF domain-containing protein [Shewanella indica]GHB20348.1 GGDEF domain-containing protein [Shewanella indica]
MNREPEAILDSVVQLTEQRQLDSLAESLVSTVSQMLSIDEVCILDVDKLTKRKGGLDGQRNVSSASLAVSVKLCIEQRREICFSNGLHQELAVPIIINDKLTKVLLVSAPLLTEQDRVLLRGFAKVYENYFHIVVESETDSLTNLLNRKAFLPQLYSSVEIACDLLQEQAQASQDADEELKLWICIFDIDYFKKINDTFGHLYGDEVLLQVSALMKQVFSAQDLMFRFGGDEFVILPSPRSRRALIELCQEFTQNLAQLQQERLGGIRISMGIVGIDPRVDPGTLLNQADNALYFVKGNGRNQVAFYGQLLAEGKLEGPQIEDDIELF